MNPDIVAAVVSFLQEAMGQSLASSTGYAQAYSDYAPQANPDGSTVSQPYAVVVEGPETYSAQADNPATGYYLSNIAVGAVDVAFYATTKAQARALGRASVRLLSDTQVQLFAQDGRVITVLPVRAISTSIQAEGVAQPTVFLRVVTFQYAQQFLE